jgi:UDP-N-acetylmuramoyl-tripeptide--D-alanyl-D-alanine ligase
MVELGEDEDKENRAFGARMGGVCDIVILVGKKRTQSIMRGLMETGFDERMVFRASNLDEATAIMGELTQAGDVILFENDLPDNYEE